MITLEREQRAEEYGYNNNCEIKLTKKPLTERRTKVKQCETKPGERRLRERTRKDIYFLYRLKVMLKERAITLHSKVQLETHNIRA